MDLLTLVILVLVLAWLFGAVIHPFGGSAIHLLLVIVIIVIAVRLLRGERL